MIKNKSQSTKTSTLSWLPQLPSSIALLDKDFNLIEASEQWLEDFGLKENGSEPRGKNIFDIFPHFSEDWKTRLEYALDGLKDITIIERDKQDGQKSHIWYLNPWKDGYGKNIGVIVKAEKISKDRALKLELKRTRQILDQKTQIAKIASWEYDLEQDKLSLSPAIRKIYGITKDFEPTIQEAISFYKNGHSRNTIELAFKTAIEDRKPWDENLIIITHDKREICVNTIGRPKFKDGKCSRILGTIQDVTDKVPKSELLPEPSETDDYLNLFRKSPVGMAVIDFESGNLIEANDRILEYLGVEREELVGHPYEHFDIFGDSIKSKLTQQLKSGLGYKPIELSILNKKNQELTLLSEGQFIEVKGKKSILVTLQNITKSKKRYKNLQIRLSEANGEIQKLVNFAHMVSHNLKSHATNFSLLLSFLETEREESKRKEILSMLSQASSSLADSIKGLREIVAIRQGLNSKKKELVLNDYIYGAEQRLSGIIKKEKVKIFNEIPDTHTLSALPAYLDNILYHLIANAIKFKKSDKTPVIVLNAEKDTNYDILSIEDNGKGIDLDKNKDRLFGLYKTVGDESESRGMGLYLVRYQLGLMKGRIDCQSTPGEGTTFRLFFPKK